VGSLHLQEQSLFDRHPGEWGAVEPDSPAEHCELIKTDEDLTSAGARENTGALRYGSINRDCYRDTVWATGVRSVFWRMWPHKPLRTIANCLTCTCLVLKTLV